MIEKNFKYNMIYQLLSPVTFRDSPAHPVSFISKHGYDWLNADKQLEFWKYFSAQLESIVYTHLQMKYRWNIKWQANTKPLYFHFVSGRELCSHAATFWDGDDLQLGSQYRAYSR